MSAVAYVRGRVAQVLGLPGPRRPRWTVQDAQLVREVCDERDALGREGVALAHAGALMAAWLRDDAPEAVRAQVRDVLGSRPAALADYERLMAAALRGYAVLEVLGQNLGRLDEGWASWAPLQEATDAMRGVVPWLDAERAVAELDGGWRFEAMG